jgi:hypothetical protein
VRIDTIAARAAVPLHFANPFESVYGVAHRQALVSGGVVGAARYRHEAWAKRRFGMFG